MPYYEAGISCRYKQPVVDSLYLARDFLREDSSDDESEAPIYPAGDRREERDDYYSAFRALGDARDCGNNPLDYRGIRHGVSENEYENHLHCESEKTPYSAAPALLYDHERIGSRSRDCRDKYDNRQNNTKDERIRQISVDQMHASVGEFFEHDVPP